MPFVNFQDYIEVLKTFMPANAYNILQDVINQTIANRSGTLLSFGIFFTLWSSISGVTSLIRGINRAYDQEETRPFWKIISVSLFFTLELTFVIIFSLVLIVFGKLIGNHVFLLLGLSAVIINVWDSVRFIIAFITVIFIFVSLYHNIPNHRLMYKDVIPGAVVASISWVIISIAFSYYVNNFGNYPKVYGNLGGIIALLMWIYLSSIIILIGAEINASLMFSKTGLKKIKNIRF